MSVNLLVFSENKMLPLLLREHETLFGENIETIFADSENDFEEFLEGASHILIDQTASLSLFETVKKDIKIYLIGDRKPVARHIDIFFQTPLRLGELIDGLKNIGNDNNLISNAPEKIMLVGNVSFHPKSLSCEDDNDVSITITEKETQFLLSLYNSDNQTQDRKTLLQDVWEYADGVETHTLETHVYRLRKKLAKLDTAIELVETVENGYRLKLQNED